ncbi:MAG: endo-1,4-beta-xylanase [Treponema sp.]|jgi:endo-1,4-beta-xylanase|nr:endo-1,4-beta-xylanase [Treponema sp.]
MKMKIIAVLLSALMVISMASCTSSQAASAKPAEQQPETQKQYAPLKDIYKDYFLIGNVINNKYMNKDYFEILIEHYNAVTCENQMKPSELAPRVKGGEYNWAPADRLLDSMIANNLKMHGHTLVWHNQTPAWMTQGSAQEVRTNLINHINTVLAHFKGKVLSWDVVNEAILENGDPGDWRSYLRKESGWYKALGADYIELAFRTAREADPDILLYYNDYNMDNQRKMRAVAAMIKEMNDKYRNEGHDRNLIDGIGLQAHYGNGVIISNVRNTIKTFADLGLIVDFSELDISAGGGNSGPGKDSIMNKSEQKTQANVYASLFKVFMEFSDHISRVTMWGLDDESSWKSIGNPCLFDSNLNPKQAFFAVCDPDQYLGN